MNGLLSVFLTYASDDIHGVLNLRSTLTQTGNDYFPAVALVSLKQLLIKNEFHGIKIYPHHIRAEGSLAAAEIFWILTEGVFSILLATPTDHSTKTTEPLPNIGLGDLGVPVASLGCIEEQGRGSLYLQCCILGWNTSWSRWKKLLRIAAAS